MAVNINFKKKNYTLSNNWIDENATHDFGQIYSFQRMRYFQILGMSKNDSNKYETVFENYVSLLGGLCIRGLELQYILVGDKNILNVYVGVNEQFYDIAKGLYMASFDGIDIKDVSEVVLRNRLKKIRFGGIVAGYPAVSNPGDSKRCGKIPTVDNVIRGMSGDYWCIMLCAKATSSQDANELAQEIREELQEISPFVRKSIGGLGIGENEQSEFIDYDAQEYKNRLEILLKKIERACAEGLWRVTGTFFSDNNNVCNKLASLIKSEFAGEESYPYLLKTVRCNNVTELINRNFGLINDKLPLENMNFLLNGISVTEEPYSYFSYKYQIAMGSREVACYIKFIEDEQPGFYLNQKMTFDCAPRRSVDEFTIGNVVENGKVLEEVIYGIDIENLTRHCLVNGITGGGKSNTSKYLLTSLYEEFNIPFLVIESAKQEYYELGRILGNNSLLVFTLGYSGKDAVEYKINPFERIGKVPLQTHIDYLLSSFKASFEMVPPMPYILETSVYEVYKDYGWDVIKDTNIWGKTEYPKLEDLYYKIEIVAEEYGYVGEMKSNVVSALQARIGSLRIGGKGAMLDVRHSFPIERILKQPTVLELDSIADDDVKAFVISLILVQLYEYRKSDMGDSTKKKLQHVMLIEEAHRLLKNIPLQGADGGSQGKAVEFFCNMLAEIRSYGQGMIISDQMPTKLAQDVLKNTNLKVCHRIVTCEDRELLGSAMNMTDEQIQLISMFKTGYAAVYSEGDSRPMLVKLPLMKDRFSKTRAQILEVSRQETSKYLPADVKKKGDGIACSLCSNCKYRMKTVQLFEDGVIDKEYIKAFKAFAGKCTTIDVEVLEKMFNTMEKKYIKRKLLNDEKLCILYSFEGMFNVSKAKLRQTMIDYLRKQ